MNASHPHLALLERFQQPGGPTSAAAIRVVIADDHSGVRGGLRELLDAADGIEVVAESAELVATSLLVAEQRPDVLVLDLGMAGGSSLHAAGRLRRRSPETQIVIVTTDDTPGSAVRALAAGAIGYVLKELADEDLAPAIRAAVQRDEYLSPPVAERLTAMRHALTDGTLTVRESEVMRLIALGHTNVEIARKLDVSARTIETHRANIHRKLGLRTRAELVRYALRCGLLEA